MSKLSDWARDFVERRLNRQYIQFICLLVLVIYVAVLVASFATNTKGRTMLGPPLGADFGAFYIAGRIFNTQSHHRIYDAALHHQLYLEHFPNASRDDHLPYVNAPFFILPFTLLARLPYSWAYFCWLVLSIVLYVAGFRLLWGISDAIPREAWPTSLLLGFSFMPFLVECLAGGQTTAVGFFFLALAIVTEHRGQQFLSGLALSVCAYKPTLLLLILPMLLITRRYSTLLGLVSGVGLLGLISLLAVGWQGCVGFINTLLYFTNASAGTASGLLAWKYVDVNSFFRSLLSNHAYLRWLMTGGVFLVVLSLLIRFWQQSNQKQRIDQAFVWALTLSWTPVLNLYVGIYDSAIVVLSVLLMTNIFYRRATDSEVPLPPLFKLLLVLLYLVPWITQPIARITGLQLYTIVLALFGSYLIAKRPLESRSR